MPRPKAAMLLAHGDHAAHPVEQRGGVGVLRLDVDRLVAVDRVHDRPAGRAAAGWRGRSRRCGRPTTASACARRRGRRDSSCRPCRSRRRNRGSACRASTAAGEFSSSILRRSFFISGARRRRMPRLMRARRVLGIGLPEIVALLGRSPFRASARRGSCRKIAHWQGSGISGVWRMMSVIGCRSSWASAMYMRGISGKWKPMWHSSPSPK